MIYSKAHRYEEGISVIMPFYNGNKFINQAIESVVIQGYDPIEVIVCVDKDSDEPRIEPKFGELVHVVENTLPERGAGVARYVAITHSRFRYLAFLDCDDLWDREKIKKQLKFMKRNDFGFCFSGYRNFNCNGAGRDYIPDVRWSVYGLLTKQFTIGCLTVIVDRYCFDKFRPILLKRRNDYLMWFDILSTFEREGVCWGAIPEALASHRMHGDSLTASPVKSLWGSYFFFRACGFSWLSSIGLLFVSTIRTLLRRVAMTPK